MKCLIKIAQKQSFAEEYENLLQGKDINVKSRAMSLSPFLDSEGIIQVGGRLINSGFNYSKKHPILICSKHPMTKLLMITERIRLLHAGPQLTLSSLRERF